jgi:LysR family transcriptional regulator for bpeEF and oprC
MGSIPMQVTIHAMNVFVRAVEHNSFVGAARSLLVDPTAVSRTISALENELGVLLFVRSTRSLKLTAEGARFHRDCEQILQRFAQATQRFRADVPPGGKLTIGMAPGLRRRVLLRAIPGFQRQYPGIELVLVSVDDRTQIGEKSIDVLVRASGVRQHGGIRSESQGLVVRKLFQSRYVVCAAPSYLDRAGVPRRPPDLQDHACVAHVSLDRDVVTEWRFLRGEQRHIFRFSPALRVQGVDAVCEAGVAGSGLVRMLAANVEDELRTRALVRILPDWDCTGTPPMVAIYRKTRPAVPQIGALVRYLVDAMRCHEAQA